MDPAFVPGTSEMAAVFWVFLCLGCPLPCMHAVVFSLIASLYFVVGGVCPGAGNAARVPGPSLPHF